MGSLAYADMEMLLQVADECPACLGKASELLRCILGIYSVNWDKRDCLFRLAGEVDPNVVIKTLASGGVHAKCVGFNFKHPHLRHQNNTGYAPSYGGGYVPHMDMYNYGSYGGGYNMLPPPSYRDTLPYYGTSDQYHPYGMQKIAAPPIEYPSYYNNTLALPSPPPPATYVPSNPYHEHEPFDQYREYDPYGNTNSGCSIM